MSTTSTSPNPTLQSTVTTPRVTIEFCTQCKWLLRAAYFAQELLSTFSTSLGEVALIPSTGGVFRVHLEYLDEQTSSPSTVQKKLLWDRKTEGGFPETKELKKRVRNIIDPSRDLGHVDGKKKKSVNAAADKKDDTNAEDDIAASTIGSATSEDSHVTNTADASSVVMPVPGKSGIACEDCI